MQNSDVVGSTETTTPTGVFSDQPRTFETMNGLFYVDPRSLLLPPDSSSPSTESHTSNLYGMYGIVVGVRLGRPLHHGSWKRAKRLAVKK